MRHFDEEFWWNILMRHFDETFWRDILTTHIYETFWWHILMTHLDETFWWHILMKHFAETHWWDILIRHFDGTFWWDILIWNCDNKFWSDILMAGNGLKFVPNLSRLVIQLLNCTTDLTKTVRHWLPWPCYLFSPTQPSGPYPHSLRDLVVSGMLGFSGWFWTVLAFSDLISVNVKQKKHYLVSKYYCSTLPLFHSTAHNLLLWNI